MQDELEQVSSLPHPTSSDMKPHAKQFKHLDKDLFITTLRFKLNIHKIEIFKIKKKRQVSA